MTYQNNRIDTQYGSTSDEFIVELVDIVVVDAAHAGQFIEAFGLFQYRVAYETVAYHHVRLAAGEDFVGFDVAHEVVTAVVGHQFVGRLGSEVPLFALFADIEQSHSRIGFRQDGFGICTAYQSVLVEYVGFAVHVQSHIQQQETPAVECGYERRDGRTDDAAYRFGGIHRPHEHRPRGTRTCETVYFSLFQVFVANPDAGIGLLVVGFGRMVVHGDNFGGVDDIESVGRSAVLFHHSPYFSFIAEKNQPAVAVDMPEGHKRSFHDNVGRIIAPHCINTDFQHGNDR